MWVLLIGGLPVVLDHASMVAILRAGALLQHVCLRPWRAG